MCCLLKRFYGSLLPLLKSPPSPHCPSMKADSVHLYIKYKRGEKDSELLDKHNIIVRGMNGLAILCDGKWKEPNNVTQLLAAIGAIHEARGQFGAYSAKCDDCIRVKLESNQMGCDFHFGTPMLWNKGLFIIIH